MKRRSRQQAASAALRVPAHPGTPETRRHAAALRRAEETEVRAGGGSIEHMLARGLITEDQARAADRILLGYRLVTGEVAQPLMRWGVRTDADTSGRLSAAEWQQQILADYRRWTAGMAERRRALFAYTDRDGWLVEPVLAVIAEGHTLTAEARRLRCRTEWLRDMLVEALQLHADLSRAARQTERRRQEKMSA